MKLVCTSDTHGYLDAVVDAGRMPDGDVLVIAGDFCPNFVGHHYGRGQGPNVADAKRQLEWLRTDFNEMIGGFYSTIGKSHAKYKDIILVAGNHDWVLEVEETRYDAERALEAMGVTYLRDKAHTIDGIKFYGIPWTPHFYDWAFNFPKDDPQNGYEAAKKCWNAIPLDTDVLITHGPPLGILDKTKEGLNVGCPELARAVESGQDLPRLQLHIFGHIHEGFGELTLGSWKDGVCGTTFANVSLVTRDYQIADRVRVFEV